MLDDKWIITEKDFNKNGQITYSMKSVDMRGATNKSKKITSNKNDVFVGSYTDSNLNSLSKKYVPTSAIIKHSQAPVYDIGTVKYSKLTNYDTNNELFWFVKFFNGSYGDFYSALPNNHDASFFNLGDVISMGIKQSNEKVPYFIFSKNLTTGQEIDDFDNMDDNISDYQEFVVIGKTKCEQTEKPTIVNEVIINSRQFGLLHIRFKFLYHLPLYMTKIGDKLLLEGKYNPSTNICTVDILRNITVDNMRSEFLLSQDIR